MQSGALVIHGVEGSLHQPIRQMAKGRILHQAIANASASRLPSGKACAHQALKAGVVDKSEYMSLRKQFENADAAKHVVVPAPLLSSPRADRWEDIVDDGVETLEDMSLKWSVPREHTGVDRDSVPVADVSAAPPISEWVPCASAQEFVPGVAGDPSKCIQLLPSIGAQLDFLLQSLCSSIGSLSAGVPTSPREVSDCHADVAARIDALECRIAGLEADSTKEARAEVLVSSPDYRAQCGDLAPGSSLEGCRAREACCEVDPVPNPELNIKHSHSGLSSRVKALEDKFEDLQNQVASQVVQAVVKQLPQLITPVVAQGLSANFSTIAETIEKIVECKQRSMFDNAVNKLKAELNATAVSETFPPTASMKAAAAPSAKVSLASACGPQVKGAKEFVEGDVVLVRGLAKSPELNGQVGFVIGFDSPSERFMVKLADDDGVPFGKVMKIKACNLLSADQADDLTTSEVAELASVSPSAGSLHCV
jgi:hypothetical protein